MSSPTPICVRCQKPVVVNRGQYETFEKCIGFVFISSMSMMQILMNRAVILVRVPGGRLSF
jgi:hypothetical protein